MADPTAPTRIPLFPLPNVVHFPGTQLKLHVFEPRYRQLVKDLLELDPPDRRIGMVLTKPGPPTGGDDPEIFPGGTAGRLVRVEYLPDGRSNIRLQGEYRFRVRQEVSGESYRQALVTKVVEPRLDETDPGITAMRNDLVSLVGKLASELGEKFPVKPSVLEPEESTRAFELMVNRIAADLDVPALQKLSLLNDPLPERALNLAEILRSRRQILALLRPFRHISPEPGLN